MDRIRIRIKLEAPRNTRWIILAIILHALVRQ